MEPAHEEPSTYLAEHVREALAQDGRLNELHIEVTIDGRRVVLRGEVDTHERCDAVTEIARSVLPDHEIDNQTTVVPLPDDPKVERLP